MNIIYKSLIQEWSAAYIEPLMGNVNDKVHHNFHEVLRDYTDTNIIIL